MLGNAGHQSGSLVDRSAEPVQVGGLRVAAGPWHITGPVPTRRGSDSSELQDNQTTG